MPLPHHVPREELHLRRIEVRGYRRHDGWYDIEARIVDTRTRELTLESGRILAPGDRLHDMWIRLVVDEDLIVVEVAASTDASPFAVCREATSTLQSINGLRIGPGWSAAVRQRLSGRDGCTHLTELLAPVATVAFQTLWEVRQAKSAPLDANGVPRKIDSCYAYASDREIVWQRWPAHYTGTVVARPEKEVEAP